MSDRGRYSTLPDVPENVGRKDSELVPLNPRSRFVTVIGPCVAPTGTVTDKDVELALVTVPRTEPNITTFLVVVALNR
jgi:hypothetical protein